MHPFLECLRHVCCARSLQKLLFVKLLKKMENQKASQMSKYEVAAAEIINAALAIPGDPDISAIPGHLVHLIGGDDYLQRVLPRMELHPLGGLRDSVWKSIRADTVKRFKDIAYVDLESGLIRNCKCCWKDECPKYVEFANDPIQRVVKEVKDKGNALKFISIERVKELKDEGYGLLCSPFGPLKELKDDGHALKFIPVEAVKVSKDGGCALKFIPVETVKELTAHGYALFIPAEIVKKLKDEYNIKMESGGMIEALVNKSWLKNKCVEYADEDYDKMESGGMPASQIDEGHETVSSCWLEKKKKFVEYANDYIEKIAKPKMGILFSGAMMQNIYQLVTSGMVNTGKGKTLLKLNEAAFMMLLYGLIMPRRAAGHIALAIGVALASTAYLVTMSFAF